MDTLIMEIAGYPPINKAKIEINKINVVGGVNGSGKSTVSKIFYSFLKGNSNKRREYALQNILDDLNIIIDALNYESNDYNLPPHLSVKDSDSYILKKYNEILEIHEKHCKLAETKLTEINDEMKDINNNIIQMLEKDYCSKKELMIIYESKKKELKSWAESSKKYNVDISSIYPESVIKDIEDHDDIDAWHLTLSSVISTLVHHEYPEGIGFREELWLSDEIQVFFNENFRYFDLDEQWHYFLRFIPSHFPSNYDIINSFTFQRRIDNYFAEDSPDISRYAVDEILSKEYVLSSQDLFFIDPSYNSQRDFLFYVNSDGSKRDAYDYFFNNFINDIWYVDNLSLMDFRFENIYFHTQDILEELFNPDNRESSYPWDKDLSQDVTDFITKIENIIHGAFDDSFFPHFSITKVKEKDKWIPKAHTSSGIKQIGNLQLLLLADKLKKDDYLIIDEPEVNLHPEWQFKFAEILVLLAKDLNITVYLNSHSPFFIETIDAFAEFYDMQEDVNYYMTEESEKEGKYDFVKINSDELYRIYDNLGKPYDLIDQLRLRKHLGE